MSDQQALRDTLRPLGEAFVPGSQQRKQAAVFSAFGADGNMLPDAVAQAVPAYVLKWYLAGAIASGTNVGEEYELPSIVRITGIRIRVKTAPAADPLQVRLTADGAEVETASVSIGESSGRSTGLKFTANAGVVLRLDVLSGDAEDATVVVSYAPAST